MTAREHSLDLLQRIATSLPVAIETDAETPASDGKTASGATVLTWNDVDQCILTFDEDLALVMSFDDDDDTGILLLTWVLGSLPDEIEERVEVMTDLLVANHEWDTTEGGVLGLDEDTSLVTLCYRIDLPLDPPELIDSIVPRLYNVSRHWANVLNSEEPSPEDSLAPDAAAADHAEDAAPAPRGGSVRDRL